jgi:hypothetical protein
MRHLDLQIDTTRKELHVILWLKYQEYRKIKNIESTRENAKSLTKENPSG